MELIFDDKTGTWGEAPEAYGTIEFATKEDYEYAKKAIKDYKELEAKHWDECRQIAHYDDELKEAKRLLKAAVEDMNNGGCNSNCYKCKHCGACDHSDRFTWKLTGEALKLIGGEADEHSR